MTVAETTAVSGPSIELEVVRHGELSGLLERLRARPGLFPVIPIDAQRVRLHAANPDAVADDPALLLVWVDGLCRAYLGLTPQYIASSDGPRKVMAFSTLLVDAPLRGAGIADRLLEGARRCGPLLTLGNSNAAQGFFRKRGLRALPPYRVVYLPLGPGYRLARWRAGLARRLAKRGWPRLAGMLGGLESKLRPSLGGWRGRSIAGLLARLDTGAGRSAEPCMRVPATMDALLDVESGRVRWRTATVNWLLDEGERAEAMKSEPALSGTYHFRQDPAPRAYRACLLRERGQDRGLALFHCHRIHGQWTLSILKVFPGDASWQPCVLAHALGLAQEYGADVVRAGSEFEALFASLRPGRPVPHRLRLGYADAPTGSHVFDDYRESFADGDIAFY